MQNFTFFMYLGRRLKINIALNPLKKRQNFTFPPDRGVLHVQLGVNFRENGVCAVGGEFQGKWGMAKPF